MSYEIEYRGDVYVRKPTNNSSSEPYYLLTLVAGDNNVYEATRNGQRRSRGEYAVCYGWNYSVIGEVCKRAGACEGGGLQPNAKWITPEAYLKRYRHKIKNAKPIEAFYALSRTARFEVPSNPTEWQKKVLDEYEEYIHEEPDYYNAEIKRNWCEITINNEAEFEKFLQLWGLSKDRYAYLQSNGDDYVQTAGTFEPLEEVSEKEKQVGLNNYYRLG